MAGRPDYYYLLTKKGAVENEKLRGQLEQKKSTFYCAPMPLPVRLLPALKLCGINQHGAIKLLRHLIADHWAIKESI